jgi:hypothetical protein
MPTRKKRSHKLILKRKARVRYKGKLLERGAFVHLGVIHHSKKWWHQHGHWYHSCYKKKKK